MKKAKTAKKSQVMPRRHRAMLKKLARQPFVLATSQTLPYLPHLPPTTIIRAHKIIAGDMGPSYHRGKMYDAKGNVVEPNRYLPGSTHHEPKASMDEFSPCGHGLHVGTVEWCQYCYTDEVDSACNFAKLLLAEVEFMRCHVAAFPRGGAEIGRTWVPSRKGKFRLHHLKVLSVRVFSAAEVEAATSPSRKANRHSGRPMLDPRIFVPKAKRA